MQKMIDRAGIAIGFLIAIARAEQGANPEYIQWSHFKPGTSVTLQTVSISNGQELKSVVTHELMKIEPDRLIIQTRTTLLAAGQSMASPVVDREIPSKVEPPASAPASTQPTGQILDEMEDTVTVNGKNYKCKVVSVQFDHEGTQTLSKTWSCPEVPGQIVRIEVKTAGGVQSETRTELVQINEVP